MTKYQKYTWVCTGDCDALIENTLKDARFGMGVTNIVLEYLEQTGRFVFTEDKLEIKERMVNQFKASNKGFTENKVDAVTLILLPPGSVVVEPAIT